MPFPDPDGSDGPLRLVVEAYSLAAMNWRRLLAVSVSVLVPAQLLSFAVLALASATDGIIVNGRLIGSEAGQRWSSAGLRLAALDAEVRMDAPVVLVVGWVIALVVCLPVLAGAGTGPPVTARSAWRSAVRKSPAWAVLAVLTAAAAVPLLLAALAARDIAGGTLGYLLFLTVLGAGGIAVARLVLALPAVLVEGHGFVDAIHRALRLTSSRSLLVGLALMVGMAVVPGLGIAATSALADRLGGASLAGTWTGAAVMAGLGALLGNLVLLAVVPVQAAVLTRAFLWAREAEAATGETGPATTTTAAVPGFGRTGSRTVGRLGLAGLVVMALLPSMAATGYVLANPYQVPVAHVGEPQGWALSDPLATDTLAGGDTVIVESDQIIRCLDAHCDDSASISMPCIDGAALRPMPGDGMGCSIEAPLSVATVRPDGTMVALRQGEHNAVRLFWCRVTMARQCEWGGAATLYQMPAWSLTVATTPDGGVVAGVIAPAKDPLRGEILLLTCRDLACAEPHVSHVGEVTLPDVWYRRGPLAVDVDQVSGSVAIGFHDQRTGELWLGGCAAVGCDDPELRSVGRWPAATPMDGRQARVVLAASPAGPVGVWHDLATNLATDIVCADVTCQADHQVTIDAPPGGPALAVDQEGAAYVVAAAPPGQEPRLMLVALADPSATPTGPVLPSLDGAKVLAVVIDGDGRAQVHLWTHAGLVVITCAFPQCRS